VSISVEYQANTLAENLEESPFPTTVQLSLPSQALFARYDPSGRFIAAGGYTGQIIVWELATKGIITALLGHNKPVTSVESVACLRILLANHCPPAGLKTLVSF